MYSVGQRFSNMTRRSNNASKGKIETPKIHTVFIQQRLVPIVEDDCCETDGKCEVYGCIEENASTRKHGRFVCDEQFSVCLIASTCHTVGDEFDAKHDLRTFRSQCRSFWIRAQKRGDFGEHIFPIATIT